MFPGTPESSRMAGLWLATKTDSLQTVGLARESPERP